MSDNTALIQDLFASIAQEGWSTKFNDALADDLVWVATGSSPVAGTYKGKQVYLEKIIKRLGDRLQSWPKPVVENLFVDGNTVCIQFHGEGGVGKNGANFDMDYCWVMRLHEGRIAHVTGYYDSVKMTALFRDEFHPWSAEAVEAVDLWDERSTLVPSSKRGFEAQWNGKPG